MPQSNDRDLNSGPPKEVLDIWPWPSISSCARRILYL